MMVEELLRDYRKQRAEEHLGAARWYRDRGKPAMARVCLERAALHTRRAISAVASPADLDWYDMVRDDIVSVMQSMRVRTEFGEETT
jgi:hypothetical protein